MRNANAIIERLIKIHAVEYSIFSKKIRCRRDRIR
jgi:hypothetical protein